MKPNRYNLNFLEYLDYDELSPSGLRWSWRPPELFHSRLQYDSFMKNIYGSVAGVLSKSNNGKYCRWITKIKNSDYINSRIISAMFNDGLTDSLMIDHINGDPSDNRLCNLRIATRSQNSMNSKAQYGHSLGVKGIRFYQGKYRARITLNKKLIHVGSFNTLEEAKLAYKEAAIELHGEFARTE